MAFEVDQDCWATAFLSIPLPSTDFLGSFSYEENDDIDFESIFADIDATMIPSPNNPDSSSDSKKTTSETVSGEPKKMEVELKYYKSIFPQNPNPNPKRTYMDVNKPIPRSSSTPVSYDSHVSGLGTCFDPLVIDDDDEAIDIPRQGCNDTIPSPNPKLSDSKNSTTSVNVGNTAIGISYPESVSSEAKKMEELEELIDFKGCEDYEYQDWSSFFPENPNPNPNRKACMDVNEPVPRFRTSFSYESHLSGLGTSFDPLVIDDDDEAIEIRQQGCNATALGAKRKRDYEGFHMGLLEGFDMGMLDGCEGNWSTTATLYEPTMKVARVN